MKTEILKNILQLDSIYGLLNWTDRVRIHLILQEKINDPTPKITLLYNWIIETNWERPTVKHLKDHPPEDSFYKSGKDWINLKDYPKFHTEITEQLQILKLKIQNLPS